jgi:CheY-like chemotaxis protein
MGYTTLAKNSMDNPLKLEDYLKKIGLYSSELLSLVNNSLDVSRLEDLYSYNVENKEFKFSSFIHYTLEVIMPMIDSHNINFNYYIENVVHEHLVGDIEKIKPILVNVLDNAIKYTPVGGNINLTIKEMSVPSSNESYYQFIIRDNGIGIKDDEIEQVYNSFFRGSNVGKVSGSGLGLTTVVSLVKLLQGNITIDSKLDKGTTVTINLKLRNTEQEAFSMENFYKAKVLVVNSNENELSYTCNLLRDLKVYSTPISFERYAVAELLNAHAKGEDYSVVMINEKLQDVDYLSLIEEIHSSVGIEPIKIVVTTFNYDLTRSDCINHKVDMILPKPLFKQEVITSLIDLTKDFKACYIENPAKSKLLKNYSCLLMERTKETQTVTTELLSMLGLKVTLTRNREELVKVYKGSPDAFDCILVDTDMPNFVGFEATKEIREVNENVPIIALSSNTFPDELSNCISRGFSFHVAKPFDSNLNFFTYVLLSSIRTYRSL